ncbi:MAG: LCP family protein [Clostridia bacterium]|nr:LCP family protein [Clostridia bacterium]
MSEQNNSENKKKRKIPLALKIILIVVLCLVLIGAALFGYVYSLLNKINRPDPNEVYLTEEELLLIEQEEEGYDPEETGFFEIIPDEDEELWDPNEENAETVPSETEITDPEKTGESNTEQSTETASSQPSGSPSDDSSSGSSSNSSSSGTSSSSSAPKVDTSRVISPDQIKFNPLDNATITGKNLINILLIGQDRRQYESTRQRSDSMILATVNKEKKTVTLTSFVRDIYVQIPGYQNNRLNAAFRFGGMKLLDQTFEKNFGVKIDANVCVDFGQFTSLIDKLGGIDIEITDAEAKVLSLPSSGMVHLNGSKTLSYARIRKIDSDIKRSERQRKVLLALYSKYKDKSATELLAMLDDILPLITTDLSNWEILSYATELLPMSKEFTVITQRVPINKSYYYATIDGRALTIIDFEKNQQFLIDTLLD